MVIKGKNLSKEEQFPISNPKKIKIGIVVSQWNQTITDRLLKGAQKVLINSKIPTENIIIKHVPGTFELPLGAQYLFEKNMVDGIICIGSVIQGETKHFEKIAFHNGHQFSIDVDANLPPFSKPKSTRIASKIVLGRHRFFDRFLLRFLIDFCSIWEANLDPCWPLRGGQDASKTPPRRVPRHVQDGLRDIFKIW